MTFRPPLGKHGRSLGLPDVPFWRRSFTLGRTFLLVHPRSTSGICSDRRQTIFFFFWGWGWGPLRTTHPSCVCVRLGFLSLGGNSLKKDAPNAESHRQTAALPKRLWTPKPSWWLSCSVFNPLGFVWLFHHRSTVKGKPCVCVCVLFFVIGGIPPTTGENRARHQPLQKRRSASRGVRLSCLCCTCRSFSASWAS